MTDASLKSTATRFLFHLPRARTANVTHKRCAENAGDSVFGDDAAQLVRGYSQQRQIEQVEFFPQTVLISGNACQHGHARQIKTEQGRVLREQLFLALLLFRGLSSVILNGKIGFIFVRLCLIHTS